MEKLVDSVCERRKSDAWWIKESCRLGEVAVVQKAEKGVGKE